MGEIDHLDSLVNNKIEAAGKQIIDDLTDKYKGGMKNGHGSSDSSLKKKRTNLGFWINPQNLGPLIRCNFFSVLD